MTPTEAVKLCRSVAAACPQQAIDDFTPDTWHDLLGDLAFDDCYAAAIAVGKRQPFVAPAEIRAEVRRIREDRLSRTPLPAPPYELADSPGRYQQAIRAGVKRLADGFAVRPALEGAPRDGEPPEEWARARLSLVPPEQVPEDPREVARQQAAESRRTRGEDPA